MARGLFRIGRVSQSAFCSAESGGALPGGIEIGVSQAGATLVSGDFDVDLVPFDVQFINTAFSDPRRSGDGPLLHHRPCRRLNRG